MTYRHTDGQVRSRLLEFSTTGMRPWLATTSIIGTASRGSMIGTGVGDALGRPAEGMSPNCIERTYGRITDYIPWRDWEGGPTGTVTDIINDYNSLRAQPRTSLDLGSSGLLGGYRQ